MPPPTDHAHTLQCMEVWGGNKAADAAASTPGIDATVISVPCDDADEGGDVHYVSLCGDGEITRVLVADVAGHGAHVSRFATALRNLIRSHINISDQSRLVRELNSQIGGASGARFATAVVATYLARSRRFTLCNASHPCPFHYRDSERRWSLLREQTADEPDDANLPLGVVSGTTYTQFSVTLQPGDCVLLYTDMLIESFGPDGKALGELGLLQLIQAHAPNPATAARDLLEAVLSRRHPDSPRDDVTVLSLYHNARPVPRLPLGQRFLRRLRTYGKYFGVIPY